MELGFLLIVTISLITILTFCVLYNEAWKASREKHWVEMFEMHLSEKIELRGFKVPHDADDVVELDVPQTDGWHRVKVDFSRNPVREANRVARLVS